MGFYKKIALENVSKYLFYFQLAVLYVVLFLFLHDRNFYMYADECYHLNQIHHFFDNDYVLIDGLTTIPGYHYVVSVIMKLLKDDSIFVARIINFHFAIFAAFIFLKTAQKLNVDAYFKTIKWLSFPILTVFFFLVYTDVFSLLLLIISTYFLVDKKYFFSLFVISLSILVSQSNIVWLGMIFAMMLYTESKYKPQYIFKTVLSLKWQTTFTIFVLICFFIFIQWNNGISMGDKSAHEINKLRFGNIFFCLFLTFAFFFFDILNYRKKIIDLLWKYKLIFAVSFIAFILFTFQFYIVDHPYNASFEDPRGFQHNRFAHLFLLNNWLTFIFGILCFISILFFAVIRFERKEFYLLYLFNFIYLLPIWMIEQRYYLPFFTFFILFKKAEAENLSLKWFNWFVYFVLTIIIVANIYNTKYFL